MKMIGTAGEPMGEWIQRQANRHHVAERNSESRIARHNLVVVCRQPDEARELIRDWERIEPESAIGMYVVQRGVRPGHDGVDDRDAVVDGDDVAIVRQGIGGVLIGAIPGAVIGALIVGGLAAIFASGTAAVWAGILSGAAFGAVASGTMSYAVSSGWSSAYRQSFVHPRADSSYIASFHADQAGPVELAELRVAERSVGRPHRFEGVPPD